MIYTVTYRSKRRGVALRALSAVAVLALSLSGGAEETVWEASAARAGEEETVPRADLEVVLANGARFVRAQQDERGGFGGVQPQLQTAVVLLALLSLATPPDDETAACVELGVAYLVAGGDRSGDLGDDAFRVESHALATTALLCAMPHVRDAELCSAAAKVARRGLIRLQRWQDRSSSSASRGGWKMAGQEGKENDRRASAWALLCYFVASRYGIEIAPSNLERGVGFLLGSFKDTAAMPDQIGGLSVDTEGLAVEMISAMGGWVLARMEDDAERSSANVAWLDAHPAAWSGPNYFYTHFFRVRALKFADAEGEVFRRALRHVYLQIRDNQRADGSVGLPPGNAQNTVAMGPVFATAMSILVLNAEQSRLVFDEDYRVWPLF